MELAAGARSECAADHSNEMESALTVIALSGSLVVHRSGSHRDGLFVRWCCVVDDGGGRKVEELAVEQAGLLLTEGGKSRK